MTNVDKKKANNDQNGANLYKKVKCYLNVPNVCNEFLKQDFAGNELTNLSKGKSVQLP